MFTDLSVIQNCSVVSAHMCFWIDNCYFSPLTANIVYKKTTVNYWNCNKPNLICLYARPELFMWRINVSYVQLEHAGWKHTLQDETFTVWYFKCFCGWSDTQRCLIGMCSCTHGPGHKTATLYNKKPYLVLLDYKPHDALVISLGRMLENVVILADSFVK